MVRKCRFSFKHIWCVLHLNFQYIWKIYLWKKERFDSARGSYKHSTILYFGSQPTSIHSSSNPRSCLIIFHQSLIYVLRDLGLKRPLNNRLNGLLSLISRKSSPLRCGLTATRQNHHQYRYKARGTMCRHPTWFTSLAEVRWGPEERKKQE